MTYLRGSKIGVLSAFRRRCRDGCNFFKPFSSAPIMPSTAHSVDPGPPSPTCVRSFVLCLFVCCVLERNAVDVSWTTYI